MPLHGQPLILNTVCRSVLEVFCYAVPSRPQFLILQDQQVDLLRGPSVISQYGVHVIVPTFSALSPIPIPHHPGDLVPVPVTSYGYTVGQSLIILEAELQLTLTTAALALGHRLKTERQLSNSNLNRYKHIFISISSIFFQSFE